MCVCSLCVCVCFCISSNLVAPFVVFIRCDGTFVHRHHRHCIRRVAHKLGHTASLSLYLPPFSNRLPQHTSSSSIFAGKSVEYNINTFEPARFSANIHTLTRQNNKNLVYLDPFATNWWRNEQVWLNIVRRITRLMGRSGGDFRGRIVFSIWATRRRDISVCV